MALQRLWVSIHNNVAFGGAAARNLRSTSCYGAGRNYRRHWDDYMLKGLRFQLPVNIWKIESRHQKGVYISAWRQSVVFRKLFRHNLQAGANLLKPLNGYQHWSFIDHLVIFKAPKEEGKWLAKSEIIFWNRRTGTILMGKMVWNAASKK